MKNIIKKICSLLALIMIILNSSVLTTLSMAIDEINTNATANVSNVKKEKLTKILKLSNSWLDCIEESMIMWYNKNSV